MWLQRSGTGEKKGGGGGNGLVAVAIDRDKGSQQALKWAIENILSRGQTVILIHVIHKHTSVNHSANCEGKGAAASALRQQLEKQTKDLFLTFHCFCTRKDVQCHDIILEDTDVVKALLEYVTYAAIENLVLGASRHGLIRRFKITDIPSSVSKGAPDFCTVHVISKGKVSSVRNSSRSAPFTSPLHTQILERQATNKSASFDSRSKLSFSAKVADRTPRKPRDLHDDSESIKIRSPFIRGRGYDGRVWGEPLESDIDISFVGSSGRPSSDGRASVSSYYDNMDSAGGFRPPRISTSSERSFGSSCLGAKWSDINSLNDFSSSSMGSSGKATFSSEFPTMHDEVEAEMRRLKLELKQTMDMYSTACKEALTEKKKAMELHRWRHEEERRLEEARLAEETALAMAEKEKDKYRAAVEAAEAAQRIAEREAQRRISAEMRILGEAEERRLSDMFVPHDVRYRRYTIEEIEAATEYFAEPRKIGEGGYGPVFKCYLDHTPVAVKVLRPDAAQGRAQFQREVEILSCMRHPNMVLLLGACPEYGCLVYEYMANGSLEDRIFRRGNTPSLSWQLRFRIAAEIATGLLFLHQTKPEPLVHRDLKPANILLDHNYVSKISDVGLARLVPPSVADDVTQYRLTSTAGTFCYIDPEYQQTGMLGVKSDVYSLGILLLQLITAKPAMGISHHVGRTIEKGTFTEMLDQAVPDWPVEEALCFAKIGVQCAELRRKDRPDLGKVVLPELNRLREIADEKMSHFLLGGSARPSPNNSYVSITQDVMSDPVLVPSGCESSKSHSSSS